MKRIFWLAAWMLTALVCSAAEIVAWKVPLRSFAWNGLESDGIVRLKSPPENSPFFREGDELWDLKGIRAMDPGMENEEPELGRRRIESKPPLEWVVWNASTRQLVTKGNWSNIWHLHQNLRIDRIPRHVRLTAEIFEIPADGAALSEKAVPSATLTWVVLSGRQFSASRQADSGLIQVEGGAVSGDTDSIIDLELKAACSVRDLPRLDFSCSLSLQTGFPCWVARDFVGGAGLDCRVTGRIELLDGTPLEEAVLIQKGQACEPLKGDRSAPMRHRIGANGWLMTTWLDPAQLASFSPSRPDPTKEVDPFAETPSGAVQEPIKLDEVKVPEILRTWFPRPVWDLRAWFEGMGLNMKDTDFAGYDPSSQRIFLFSDLATEVDKFEALVTFGCVLQPKVIVVGVEGNGQTRLVTRSGQRSGLSRSLNGRIVRSLEIEPTIGESGDLLDLHLDYLDESNPAQKQTLKSAVVLCNGQALDVAGDAKDREGGKLLRVKAEIENVNR